MVVCPKCQTQNRPGARFCMNCATPLSVATRPLDEALVAGLVSEKNNPAGRSGNPAASTPLNGPATGQGPSSETHPLDTSQPFAHRPTGAVFGERFLLQSLLYSDERQNRYLVSQLNLPLDQQVRACPNPACGAIFSPAHCNPEKFCTDCGTPLGPPLDVLVIWETATPPPANLRLLVEKCLTHSAIRPPLAFFEEQLGGVTYHALVLPNIPPLEHRPEPQQALGWAVSIAAALDYLHANGVTFNGRIDPSCFGLTESRAVWTNFAACAIYADGLVPDRQPDLRALTGLIFNWVTGRAQYEPVPGLPPALHQFFELGLTGSGFSTALELSQALEAALLKVEQSQPVDFEIGRRTSTGMVRNLNEDSLMALEFNRLLQSVSQPLGVFVVADGMGGHAAGEIASGAIVNAIASKALAELLPRQVAQTESLDCERWLRRAVEYANQAVYDLRKSAGTDMGSTMVAAVIEGNTAYVTHVGDSRVYLVNSQGIRQITVDHSLVERLIATNQITREEARHHPQRNVIYRTIGDKAKVDLEVGVHLLKPGEQLMLCSDGMSGMVDDQAMYRIIKASASPQQACDELVAAANRAGGEDNISVILVKLIQP